MRAGGTECIFPVVAAPLSGGGENRWSSHCLPPAPGRPLAPRLAPAWVAPVPVLAVADPAVEAAERAAVVTPTPLLAVLLAAAQELVEVSGAPR
jgi:hypothetical protein